MRWQGSPPVTTPHSEFSHPKYRPDIDGLRAVAVLSVVVFHAFPGAIRGGFTGVDVFFVISGFLISTIIFENLAQGTFSFATFYARRIKRIFPALLLVLAASLAFGWFALFSQEYQQLGRHVAAGAGFVANLVLWGEAGYFDNSAETKPMLHLWSLGVEEQFYIVWPLVVWLAWRLRLRLGLIALVVAALSFALSVKGVKSDAVAAFYSPLTRFWELLFGTVLAWLVLEGKKAASPGGTGPWQRLAGFLAGDRRAGHALSDALSVGGLLLLVLGFWGIRKSFSFPGAWALLPVLGATLIIAAGPQAWVNRTLLSHKLAVWFGLISFPLYLWHWPLLSFARVVQGEAPSAGVRIALVALAVALAWLTYKLVERRVRGGSRDAVKVGVLVVLAVLLGVFGYTADREQGYPLRAYNQKFVSYKDSIKVPDRAAECFEIPYAYRKPEAWYCHLGPLDAPVKYFAYGDSHALSLLPALEKFAQDTRVAMKFTGTSGCPSLVGLQSLRGQALVEKYNCRALNDRVFEYVKASGIENVILINRWTYYSGSIPRPPEFNPVARDPGKPIDGAGVTQAASRADLAWAIHNTVSRYAQIGVRVIFVEDIPQQTFEPVDVLRKGRAVEAEYLRLSVKREEHEANQKWVNEVIRGTGAKVINFDDILCQQQVCPLVGDGKFWYSDDDHLSVEGAMKVYPRLAERLRQ